MSGHSKWSTIKHKKGAADARRGQAFNRIGKELTVASRLGGADPASNPRLRIAVSKARAANMPKDTMERAIKKGAGGEAGNVLEEVRYEIYAPGGVAMIVDALTDKKARTTPEIKSMINKNNCNLAESGAVSRLFQLRGNIIIERSAANEDELMELALEAGADDMNAYDEYYEILTEPDIFPAVSDALDAKNISVQVAEVQFLPLDGTEIEISSAEQAKKLMRIMELFEEHEDVQAVYNNMSIDEAIISSMD